MSALDAPISADSITLQTARWPGAIHRSFSSRVKANQWILETSKTIRESSASLLDRYSYVNRPTLAVLTQSNAREGTEDSGRYRRRQTGRSAASGTAARIAPERPLHEPNSGVSANSSIVLSPEQKKVLQMVREGRNVFFTGSAGLHSSSHEFISIFDWRRYTTGTGKSVLLREIIKTLGGGASSTLAITASTGIASVNIGGTTVHSWAGIGLGQEPAKTFAGKFLKQSVFAPIVARWRSVETLIIDESEDTS